MTTILLLAVFFGTAAAIVLIIYLIDRVNILEQMTLENRPSSTEATVKIDANADSVFLGLSGKILWDAMSGKTPEGFNDNDLVALKSRYEHVLTKHIELLFKDGATDRQQGKAISKPKLPASIKTLRGTIDSWIPPQHASAIFKAGFESIEASDIDRARIASYLDDSTELLFSRTDIALRQAFSEKLLPQSQESSEEPLEELPDLSTSVANGDNDSII